ncbi:uncharacterized protein EI90DRAFT_480799 [Cantharellus anzutake]|uniref:uncharacterized protein n=1 Tax=Cantharellus anzutake TaxID=1750568 RepID=UPI001905C062|nr:uncharacterized protein EI90DRAFT_480799 [Cantharellus anzutake]KAF8313895.1 hypothetical protein EI90DRAFT_480799 [Cantharellus anzutake]
MLIPLMYHIFTVHIIQCTFRVILHSSVNAVQVVAMRSTPSSSESARSIENHLSPAVSSSRAQPNSDAGTQRTYKLATDSARHSKCPPSFLGSHVYTQFAFPQSPQLSCAAAINTATASHLLFISHPDLLEAWDLAMSLKSTPPSSTLRT